MINLENTKKIYFVGIGGIAMSAAACLAKQAGFKVIGSDSKEVYNPAKKVLDEEKIEYFLGYSEENIKKNPADLYVFSAGEDLQNPEVNYILKNNLARSGFPELLYELNKNILRVVVTGTHGKTTTTGILGYLLKNLDNSGFMAGGVLQNTESNFYLGCGHYFVFEGDEYKTEFDDPAPKFHYYKPDILVLTNLEYDHPDMFENFEALENEFKELVDKMPEDGLIVYNADNAHLAKIVHQSNISSVSFGIANPADFTVENIQFGEYVKFEVINKSSTIFDRKIVLDKFSRNQAAKLLNLTENYQIQLPGQMNVYNALAAIATLRALGFQPQQLALELLSFKGIKRRFELVGVKNGITIIDDYAHHPTAVRETLEAARLKFFSKSYKLKAKTSKLWAIFEPHTFSRTKATLSELAGAFDSADEVLISEIYPARESIKDASISSADVVQAIGLQKDNVRLVHNKNEALSILKAELKPSDVVIIMAVGSFNRLAYELKEVL